jgi:hypothetical protein
MPRVFPSQVVTLIHKLFPFTENQTDTQKGRVKLDHNSANSLSAISNLSDQIPSELITLDSDEYASYTLSLASIRPAPSTVALTFISDADFRENLCNDISAANQALSNGEWKAATVLAGATVEALLFWALKQQSSTEISTAISNLISTSILSSDPGNDIEKWSLHHLIEVANDLDTIKNTTADQARLAKNFRNLIHPGRATRLGQICDRGTALSAIAAIEHVVRDLSP